MKRGWIIFLIFLTIITASSVSAKTFNFSGCWGIELCTGTYTCGVYDSVCPEDYFLYGSGASCATDPKDSDGNIQGYLKCLDPDCKTCMNGAV